MIQNRYTLVRQAALEQEMSGNYQYPVLETRGLLAPLQERAVSKMCESRGGLVWWKVGEGKTRIGLFSFAALQNVYRWNLPSICLIVCRRRAFYDWRKEINLCFPSAQVYEDSIPVHPPSRQPVFFLVSHGMLAKNYEELHENKLIRFVILDEGWLYANNKSERFKAAYFLTNSRIAVLLSGTVMKARDTCEIFNQASVVHKQRYLATNLTKFRSLYQTHKLFETQSGKMIPRVSPKKDAYRQIMQRLKEVADINFPKGARTIHEQYHDIEATRKQLEYFRELRETYSLDELGLEYNHAIVISIKAQQIANGWVKGENGIIHSVPSNKPEKLADELSDIIAAGEKAVVWCAFRYDVEMLADYLKVASLQMLGGEDFDVDRWNNSDIRVCLATEASGSSVNYFEHTPYAIYYSANYKWLDMQQSRGRTDRKSSRHTECFYKYLQVDGSLDAHVFRTAVVSGAAERKLIVQSEISNWLKPKL